MKKQYVYRGKEPNYFSNKKMLLSNYMDENREPDIRKAFCNNTYGTIVVSLSNKLAIKHGIKKGTNVLLEDRPDGILIKKLVIK